MPHKFHLYLIKSYKIEAAHEKEKDRERQRERETETYARDTKRQRD